MATRQAHRPRILIIGDRLARESSIVSIAVKLFPPPRITVVCRSWLGPDAKDVNVFVSDPVRLVDQLVPLWRVDGFSLIICTDMPTLLCAERIKASIDVWEKYLEPTSGNIVFELHRRDPDEHYEITDATYRLAIRSHPLVLTSINAVPRDNDATTTLADVRTAVFALQTLVEEIEDIAPGESSALAQRAASLLVEMRRRLKNTTQAERATHFMNELLTGKLYALAQPMSAFDADTDDAGFTYFESLLAARRKAGS